VNREKYIGLDVHPATISVAGMDSKGKVVMESILETKAATILEFFAGWRGTLLVTFEEGTWAAWLYDLRKPHGAQVVVCNPRQKALLKHGNKSDRIDARKLADRLRLHDLEPVYQSETGVRRLRELARSYRTIVKDLSRVRNRRKALSGSGAIPGAGRDVYDTRHRRAWLGKIRTRRAEPSNFISNGTGCSTCARKPGENCWRRVASIPSPPNCGRFPRGARLAPLGRWLGSRPRIGFAPSARSGPTADWGWKPATAGNTARSKAHCGAPQSRFPRFSP
jgi:transposase